MSTELPPRNKNRQIQGRVAIVCATYNEKYTSALLQNCLDELQETSHNIETDVVRVPGAFEVPVMVQRVLTGMSGLPKADVVIALGVILRGSTAHADLIGSAVTNKLLDMACESQTPIVHEVLLLNDEQQAFARCIASALNRGREAARAATNMLELLETQADARRLLERAAKISRTGSLI